MTETASEMTAGTKNARAVKVDYRHIDDLIPYAMNARTHSPEQVEQIARSIGEFGWTNPVLVDGSDGVIAGHGRILAARMLGIEEIPCIVIPDLDETQRRALVLADNQLALNAGWDEEMLKAEIEALIGAEFDIGLLGFPDDDIKALMADQRGRGDPEHVPDVPAVPHSQLGDVWLCGAHRIMCGDSLDPEHVRGALGDLTADIANCDPPYGIEAVKGGHTGGAKAFGKGRVHGRGKSGLGKVHGNARNAIIDVGTYAPIIGDDTTETAIKSHAVLVELGVPVIVMWGGNYFANAIPPSRCWLVWDKENSGSFADAELAWTNQDRVVRLIRHQWNGLIKASERGQKRVHPTQKPVALAEWVVETMAPDAKVVLDLFLGSGWTLIAAEQRGIACVGVEMAPAYVDVAVRRWEEFTGQKAVHAVTNAPFPDPE